MSLTSDVSSANGEQQKPQQQFEKCSVKSCKYYNEEGYCTQETCLILNETPGASSMVTKICMFCGDKFATNSDSMQIQACPACLEGFMVANRHGSGTNSLSGTQNIQDLKMRERAENKDQGSWTSDSNTHEDKEELDQEEMDEVGDGGGHQCMFCGEQMTINPSIMFPACPKCFENLKICASEIPKKILKVLVNVNPSKLKLAGSSAHCSNCED